MHLELTPGKLKTTFGVYIRHAAANSGDYVGTYSHQYDRGLVLGPSDYTATVTLTPSSSALANAYYFVGVAQLVPGAEPSMRLSFRCISKSNFRTSRWY